MNNTLVGINSRITEAEEQINGLEDRMVEITTTEQNIEKRMKKKNEDSQRDLWDNIKCTNIHTLAKIIENIFEEITWERKQSTQSRKHTEPQEGKPEEEGTETTTVKLTKFKDRDKMLKATRGGDK